MNRGLNNDHDAIFVSAFPFPREGRMIGKIYSNQINTGYLKLSTILYLKMNIFLARATLPVTNLLPLILKNQHKK